MGIEDRTTTIFFNYMDRSNGFVSQNIGRIVDYLGLILQDDEMKQHLDRTGLDPYDMLNEFQSDSEKVKGEVMDAYCLNTSFLMQIFFDIPGYSDMAEYFMDQLGFDFVSETKSLRSAIHAMPDKSDEEIVCNLLIERGLFATKPVLDIESEPDWCSHMTDNSLLYYLPIKSADSVFRTPLH